MYISFHHELKPDIETARWASVNLNETLTVPRVGDTLKFWTDKMDYISGDVMRVVWEKPNIVNVYYC